METKLYPVSQHYASKIYYPYGNTPAEDFLENVHPDEVKEPNILVLGCGDIRSCFYTLWKHFILNGEPKSTPSFSGVHFILNDRSAAVLARNILFLYLCMNKPTKIPSVTFNKWFCSFWAIWFSRNLTPEHRNVLDSALNDLLIHGADLASWASERNRLNTLVHFTSQHTLHKVYGVWKMWSTNQFISERSQLFLPACQNTDIENLLGLVIYKSLTSDERDKIESEIESCSDGNSFAEYVVCKDFIAPVKKLVANVTMHEGADGTSTVDSLLPFRCFHHSFKFSLSRLQISGINRKVLDELIVRDEQFIKYPLLANSIQQFAIWLSCTSVLAPSNQSHKSHITFKFHCSDAIEFCVETQLNPALLTKLGSEYFDVIYSSNLIDHVYPPTLVLYSVPLLKPNGYLFTTTMKYKALVQTTHTLIEMYFGVDNKMLPIILGIRCINHDGSQYRSDVTIRPTPAEANSWSCLFTPFYFKPLIWGKVPSIILPKNLPSSRVWHELCASISTTLSFPIGTCNLLTAVRMLQTFLKHTNADDSDGTFWDPLCSLLKCDHDIKHLLNALQTHAIRSELHLHLLVTDKTCPLCTKVVMSNFFGDFHVSVNPSSQSPEANIKYFAKVHKSKLDPEYSIFDCFVLQDETSSLTLCFIAPLHLCESESYVSITTDKLAISGKANDIEPPKLLKSCLSSEITYDTFSVPKHQRCSPNTGTLGCLKSHYGEGDTFESVILLSEDAYSTYLECMKIVTEKLSGSKIQLHCGIHDIQLNYPYPIDFSTLHTSMPQLNKTVTVYARRTRCEFQAETAPLFLVNPDNMLTLPKRVLHEHSLNYSLNMQFSTNERLHLQESLTSCPPLVELKNLISMIIRDKQVYFTCEDEDSLLCGMVVVINHVFDYQLKAPAVDLLYCVTKNQSTIQKWRKFLVPFESNVAKTGTIKLLKRTFEYFSRRTVCSREATDMFTSIKQKVGNGFKRAVVYPLYDDPDITLRDRQFVSNNIYTSCTSCSFCRRSNILMPESIIKCDLCLELQFCQDCRKHQFRHKRVCEMKERLGMTNKITTAAKSLTLEIKECSYCSTRSNQLKKCSKCKLAWYCNQGCQARHWKEHKKECRLHDYDMNQLECCLNSKPSKYYPENKSPDLTLTGIGEISRCTYCSKASNELKMCLACHAAQYCNKECQKKHWRDHKRECKSGDIRAKSDMIGIPIDGYNSTSSTIEHNINNGCSFCALVTEGLKRCTRCKKAQYCGKACQENHWKEHKQVCIASPST